MLVLFIFSRPASKTNQTNKRQNPPNNPQGREKEREGGRERKSIKKSHIYIHYNISHINTRIYFCISICKRKKTCFAILIARLKNWVFLAFLVVVGVVFPSIYSSWIQIIVKTKNSTSFVLACALKRSGAYNDISGKFPEDQRLHWVQSPEWCLCLPRS